MVKLAHLSGEQQRAHGLMTGGPRGRKVMHEWQSREEKEETL